MKKYFILIGCLMASLLVGCNNSKTDSDLSEVIEESSIVEIEQETYPEEIILERTELPKAYTTKNILEYLTEYYAFDQENIRLEYVGSNSNGFQTWYDFKEYCNDYEVVFTNIRLHIYLDEDEDMMLQGYPITDVSDLGAKCPKVMFDSPLSKYTIDEAMASLENKPKYIYTQNVYVYSKEDNRAYFCWHFGNDFEDFYVDSNNLENYWYHTDTIID